MATTVTDGAIVINEVMADALTGLTDEDGELSDWIELYNTTDQVVSLKNYALSDKENRPLKWRFPEDAVIAPHGYLHRVLLWQGSRQRRFRRQPHQLCHQRRA